MSAADTTVRFVFEVDLPREVAEALRVELLRTADRVMDDILGPENGGETICGSDPGRVETPPIVVECSRPAPGDEFKVCYVEARTALERIDEAFRRHGMGLPGSPSLVTDIPAQVEKLLAQVAKP